MGDHEIEARIRSLRGDLARANRTLNAAVLDEIEGKASAADVQSARAAVDDIETRIGNLEGARELAGQRNLEEAERQRLVARAEAAKAAEEALNGRATAAKVIEAAFRDIAGAYQFLDASDRKIATLVAQNVGHLEPDRIQEAHSNIHRAMGTSARETWMMGALSLAGVQDGQLKNHAHVARQTALPGLVDSPHLSRAIAIYLPEFSRPEPVDVP